MAGHKKVLGVRRSWRAGADCKSVGLSLRWFESTHSHQNRNTTVSVVFLFCDRGVGGSVRAHRAHGQYADEQLANLQKRVFLIEFLRLDLIIVYQGRTHKKTPAFAGVFISIE